ncbi:MAG: dephospho-CoA kinase [Nitrospirae bacterium]|nr:dephospho-CoA kinase [Nitrospirota bacterium]
MGKSAVLSMFRDLGAVTLNTDRIVKILLTEKDILTKIRGLLGDDVFDKNGGLNKEQVAKIVFNNKELRHLLEDILHPPVFERIDDFLDKIKMNDATRVVIIEAPVLFERGYEGRFDRTITVHTKEEITLTRLEKEGIDRGKAFLILKAQLPIEEKIKRADFVIDNNGTLEETRVQVEKIYKRLVKI